MPLSFSALRTPRAISTAEGLSPWMQTVSVRILITLPVTETTAPGAKPVAPLLFEGIRRYDEFLRASALAPDESQFASTGQRPTNVEDEPNTDLVKSVWQRALNGGTPLQIEGELPVDSYRVRRLFEHWLTEGSLTIKEG